MQDREFHDTVARIMDEVKTLQAQEILAEPMTNGGLGARLIANIRQRMLPSSANEELETDDVAEAARILGHFEMVKPGIACLAQPLERGLCSSPLAIRDVGACTPSCIHRLELSAQRQDRRRKILYLLEQAETATGGYLVFYQGQILSGFEAFPDLINEFSVDPRLRVVLGNCDPSTWAACRPEVREQLTDLFALAA